MLPYDLITPYKRRDDGSSYSVFNANISPSFTANLNFGSASKMSQSTMSKISNVTDYSRTSRFLPLSGYSKNERKVKTLVSKAKRRRIKRPDLLSILYPKISLKLAYPYIYSDFKLTTSRSVQWPGGQQGVIYQTLFPLWETSPNESAANGNLFPSLSLEQMVSKCNDAQSDSGFDLWTLPNITNGTTMTESALASLTDLNKAEFVYYGGQRTYRFQNTCDIRVKLLINEYTPKEKMTIKENPINLIQIDNAHNASGGAFSSRATYTNTYTPTNQHLDYKDKEDLGWGPKSFHAYLHSKWNVSDTKVIHLGPGDVFNYVVEYAPFSLTQFQQLYDFSQSPQPYTGDVPIVNNWDFIPLFTKFFTIRCQSEILNDKQNLTSVTVDTVSLNVPDPLTAISKGMGQISTCIINETHSFRKFPSNPRTNFVYNNQFNFKNTSTLTSTQVNAATATINNETNEEQSVMQPTQAVYLTDPSGVTSYATINDNSGRVIPITAIVGPDSLTASTMTLAGGTSTSAFNVATVTTANPTTTAGGLSTNT